MPAIPTWSKLHLGRYLERLRLRAGLTMNSVATRLGLGESSMSRLENGVGKPSEKQLAIMLDMYDASTEEREEARRRWTSITRRRFPFASAVSDRFRMFIEAEAAAEYATTLDVNAVPGLLTTREYEAVLHEKGRPVAPGVEPERASRVREYRQGRVAGDNPLNLHAYIDEGVLHRTRGMGPVGVDQLSHLLERAELPNVTIQVVPFSSGLYGPMSGSIAVLGFEQDDTPAAVYLEFTGGGAWVENQEDVARFEALMQQTADAALSVEESLSLIVRIARSRK